MKFVNQRLYHTKGNKEGDYTCGHLTNREGFESFMLEDTYNDTKIAGVTRIPAGFRELKILKVDTPLTKAHRISYAAKQKLNPEIHGTWFLENPDWFHIEITGVANYKGIYIHSGIDDSHTLGCNLPCFAFDTSVANNQGAKSLAATNKFYSIVYPLLESGTKVFLETRDEIMK